MNINMKKIWRIWAKTMGDKITENDFEANVAATIRTFFWLLIVVTNFFIIANAIRHWND